jgi:beta-glucosidase/6-phospho-beta-glucosidase/beta-galactosidase
LINTCLEYGVEPIVTLYHWDLPLYLQNLYGGWLSEEIVPDFVEYARVVFNRYHDRVSKWFTVNEPIVFCGTYPQPDGYFVATDIPKKQQPYFCGQSVLLAHAGAYHVGKSINSSLTISFKNNGGYKIPLTNSSDDAIAVQRAWDFNEGWFANPVFINGSYPGYLEEYVSTFLRPLNDSEKEMITNTSDIFAHDAYTSQFYMAPDDGFDACTSNDSHPLFPACVNTTYTYAQDDGGWNIGYAADPLSPWLVGLRFLLVSLRHWHPY